MKIKRWILLVAAAAVFFGALPVVVGYVPTSALSYRAGEPLASREQTLLSLSLPAFPPLEQREAIAAAKPGWTATAAFSQTDYSLSMPAKPEGANAIVTKSYASSLSVNNNSPKTIDVQALVEHVPAYDLNVSGPTVLILHTHGSESYNDNALTYYSSNDTRTTKTYANIVRMGEILSSVLIGGGYNVLHCQLQHDKEFNQSYTKSNQTIQQYLNAHPSIAVVVDLHRDSLLDATGTKYRPVVTINGEQTAQVMLLMGVGNDIYPHPNWTENLSLALRIQATAQEVYPGFMRPVLVRPARYNQHLSTGAILVELGACGNSPAEAEQAALLFGDVLVRTLDQIKGARE